MPKRFKVLEDFRSEELGINLTKGSVHRVPDTDGELAKQLANWLEEGKVEEVDDEDETAEKEDDEDDDDLTPEEIDEEIEKEEQQSKDKDDA